MYKNTLKTGLKEFDKNLLQFWKAFILKSQLVILVQWFSTPYMYTLHYIMSLIYSIYFERKYIDIKEYVWLLFLIIISRLLFWKDIQIRFIKIFRFHLYTFKRFFLRWIALMNLYKGHFYFFDFDCKSFLWGFFFLRN